MPNRVIRQGILDSERVNALSFEAEVFYRRLMSVVDDFGRFDGRTSILRTSCYPLKIDTVSEKNIADWLSDCSKNNLLRCYKVEGKPYIEILNFDQQVRVKRSKYPEFQEDCEICYTDANHMHSICMPETKPNQSETETNPNPKQKEGSQARSSSKEKKFVQDFDIDQIDEKFRPVIKKWIDYRKGIGKQIFKSSFAGVVDEIKKLSENNAATAMMIVDQSINRSWTGLFKLKIENNYATVHNNRPIPSAKPASTGGFGQL